MTPTRKFDNRSALVTGGARGIGRAIALRLAAEGARVAITYHSDENAARQTAAQLGAESLAIRADAANRDAVNQCLAQIAERWGRLDTLVNNAALVRHCDPSDPIDDTLDAMEAMWRANVAGALHTVWAAVPLMEAMGGAIVNVSSIAGIGNTSRGTTAYGATKSALNLLTRRLALELGPKRIRVNAVAPGLILTDLITRGRTRQQVDTIVEDFSRRSVLGRVGNPDDIAAAIAFLASPDASFITGQVLAVEGGRTDYLST